MASSRSTALLSAFCILALCFTFAPGKADSPWKWEHPLPQGMTLNDIDVYGASTAIAVGYSATMIKTVDAGVTWTVEINIAGLTTVLDAVSFADAATVVAVGNDGVIVRSPDAGENWNVQLSGTTNRLYDVEFGDAMHGTAVGDSGTVLLTIDGGVTWSPQSSGTLGRLYGVSYADADTGWVVGIYGTILRTVDGGTNWAEQMVDSTIHLSSVHAVDANTATAVGWNGVIRRTTDGGTTWAPQVSGTDDPLHSVFFSDADHGVAVGSDYFGFEGRQSWWGSLLRTDNGGTSWTRDVDHTNLYGVGMFDANSGLAVGAQGIIRKITDGGVTWPQIGGGEQRQLQMEAVDFFDPQRGVAAASWGWDAINNYPWSRVFYTTDGGVTWDSTIIGSAAILDVAFADETTVYAVGHVVIDEYPSGVCFKSTDGGATWDFEFGSSLGWISAVDFAGPNAGVVVGWGYVAITIQNGVPAEVPLPDGAELWGVSVPTPTTAYAVGNGGVILKSIDSGDTWSPQNSGTTEFLVDVSFSDATHGTAVGSGGLVLRTTDGGTTWTPQTSGTTETLRCVSFASASNGVIGGRETFLTTANGGDTWVSEATLMTIWDVNLVDLFNVTAVGGIQNIMARRGTRVPVYFQEFAARASDYSVELTWSVASDEAIEGFRLYRREGGTRAASLTANLIPPNETSYSDRDVRPAVQYEYTLAAVNTDGSETLSRPVTVRISPAGPELLQNHPNPFNPTTTISFTLPARAHATLTIHNIEGRLVAKLVDGVIDDGIKEVTWDGTNSQGIPASSGVYFYRLKAGNQTLTKKMVLLK